MSEAFVHLHLHTEYSLVDGTARLKPMIERCRARGMPAVAVTDQMNLFALVKFYRAAERAGIKPIAGADVLVRPTDETTGPSRLTLLIQDRQGYLNLCKLISRGYREGQFRGVPHVAPEWFDGLTDGLIALSGARDGDIGQAILAGHPNRARGAVQHWCRLFPDRFYVELQRTGRDQEAAYENAAVHLAAVTGTPVVATNDVRFVDRDDFRAHEARVCIHDGRLLSDKRRERRYSEEQYLKSPDEMRALFEDLPEAIDNAVEIARRCNLEMTFGEYFLPAFPTPNDEPVESFLERVSREGLEERLAEHGIAEDYQRADYDARLQRELGVINSMGFPGYFLIVADFIRWAKRNDIPVGPGRGSGAGSLVAWALGITGLDPLRYDLLFERFLNPERVSMPDFDIDFCMEQRDRVIEYVAERYGRDQVSQIITFGTMAAKAAVRDCGRVLGHGYGFVDSIAKLIPLELGITLDKALKDEPELKRRYQEEEDTRAVLDLARSLEGLTRNAGKHAGGVVIAPSPLTDFSPMFVEDKGDKPVVQFDKDDTETIGLVKFDFLGLRTLTIIDHAVAAINERRRAEGASEIDPDLLPLDDPDTYGLIQSSRTTAVFQLESRGMRDLIRRLVPDAFEEIVALVALFRPGPLESGMVGDYIDRKHGRAEITYLHPRLEQILEPTYGVILYQEQVMQIAQELAGYTLGDADLLRRAMGKKKPAEMAKQREIFVRGATERDIDSDIANPIFDQMETFAGYGFNKSHSVAYALIAYQTAWLKAHYPAEFMAAVLSADLDSTDKIEMLIRECRRMGLEILPPCINDSDWHFRAEPGEGDAPGKIRYGLGAIKGVGHNIVASLTAERDQHGPFADLVDLCLRTELAHGNMRVLETLVRSGALDRLDAEQHRARLMHALPETVQAAARQQADREAGQNDLFGGDAATPVAVTTPETAIVVPAWSKLERLAGERQSLGLYLSGHPVEVHAADLAQLTTCPLSQLARRVPRNPDGDGDNGYRRRGVTMTLAGLVTVMRRRGQRGRFVTIEDPGGRLEVALFDEVFSQYQDVIRKDEIVVVEGDVSPDDFSGGYRMTARSVLSLSEARSRFARGVAISVRGPHEDLCPALESTFAPYRSGSAPVFLDYCNDAACARLELGAEWTVKPCEELIAALNALDAVNEARLVF